MRKPRSIDDFLFFNYDVKAKYLYTSYDINRYLDLLITRLNVISNLRKICSKSKASCVSRYAILSEKIKNKIHIEDIHIQGEYKAIFYKQLLERLIDKCLTELKSIARVYHNIDFDNCDMIVNGNNVTVVYDDTMFTTSLIEGRMYSNHYKVVLGEESKIDIYLDWIGEVIEYERSVSKDV